MAQLSDLTSLIDSLKTWNAMAQYFFFILHKYLKNTKSENSLILEVGGIYVLFYT